MSSEYGFTINTEQATYIENTETNYHSYTFPIQRPIETEYLENLVLSVQNDETYKLALTTYNITEQEKQLILDKATINLEGKITITYLEDENLIDALLNKATTTEQCLVYDYSYGACDNGDTYIHEPQPFANGGMCTGSTQTIIGASYDMDCLDGISTDNGSPGIGTDSTNTGTNTNNQTDNGGADPTSIVVTAPVVLQPWQQVVSCLNTISETGNNGFTSEMAAWLQTQSKCVSGSINNFLSKNSCNEKAQEIAILAIENSMNNENAFLPFTIDPLQIQAEYNPNLFGDAPNPATQLDHDAIKSQYEQTRTTDGDLAAVNYLINTYSMESFGPNNVSFDYSISFADEVEQGHAITVPGYDSSGNMVSCEIIIENSLFTFSDFGFITRVIKHELYHVLQNEFYGQNGISNAAKEFDAYYSQIFRFNKLKQIQDLSIIEQLAQFMYHNMNQMTDSEKAVRQDMIDRAKQQFPKICGDD
ncbi:hypothetical protein [Pontimicrobium sp. MEBiC06410]